jgi:hypothetical protein
MSIVNKTVQNKRQAIYQFAAAGAPCNSTTCAGLSFSGLLR